MLLVIQEFIFRPANENDTDLVLFQNKPFDGHGCWSKVGRQGGTQKIQLSDVRCYTKAKIAHEIYHSIGFYHEHSRTDRDSYVKVNYNCIRNDLKPNFYVQPKTETYGLPYDGKSIMHYRSNQGSTDVESCKTITSKVGVSNIQAKQLYSKWYFLDARCGR